MKKRACQVGLPLPPTGLAAAPTAPGPSKPPHPTPPPPAATHPTVRAHLCAAARRHRSAEFAAALDSRLYWVRGGTGFGAVLASQLHW